MATSSAVVDRYRLGVGYGVPSNIAEVDSEWHEAAFCRLVCTQVVMATFSPVVGFSGSYDEKWLSFILGTENPFIVLLLTILTNNSHPMVKSWFQKPFHCCLSDINFQPSIFLCCLIPFYQVFHSQDISISFDSSQLRDNKCFHILVIIVE